MYYTVVRDSRAVDVDAKSVDYKAIVREYTGDFYEANPLVFLGVASNKMLRNPRTPVCISECPQFYVYTNIDDRTTFPEALPGILDANLESRNMHFRHHQYIPLETFLLFESETNDIKPVWDFINVLHDKCDMVLCNFIHSFKTVGSDTFIGVSFE